MGIDDQSKAVKPLLLLGTAEIFSPRIEKLKQRRSAPNIRPPKKVSILYVTFPPVHTDNDTYEYTLPQCEFLARLLLNSK